MPTEHPGERVQVPFHEYQSTRSERGCSIGGWWVYVGVSRPYCKMPSWHSALCSGAGSTCVFLVYGMSDNPVRRSGNLLLLFHCRHLRHHLVPNQITPDQRSAFRELHRTEM